MAKRDIRGAALEYVEQGVGEPVVLVHGSASDHRTWSSQLDAFGKSYRAIAYSRRYHWPNARIPAGSDYAMDEQVEDLRAFLRSVGEKPVHLVGHSYGAFLGLLLAMAEPQLIRTLVLAEPPVITLFVSNTPKPLEILRLLCSRPRTAFSIIKFGATGIGPATAAARRNDMEEATRIFGRAVLGADFFGRLSPSRVEQASANAIRAEFLGSGFAALDGEDLHAVRIPTLLVSGQHSPDLFHRLIDRLEELLPRTERVVIPGASHIMHEDNTSAYNAAVASFWARHPSTA